LFVLLTSAEFLAEQFIPQLTELLSLDVRFAGVALDNENTENLFFDLLQDQFEFLLHIPCSSHVIQLVVKNILKHSSIQQPLQKMIEILNEIASTKELRLKVQNMAKSEHINVILTKPNATRWNSTLKAIKAFITYKKVINYFKGNYSFFFKVTIHISFLCNVIVY
jgi:galactitol-specific phosphotransferase system IIB component